MREKWPVLRRVLRRSVWREANRAGEVLILRFINIPITLLTLVGKVNVDYRILALTKRALHKDRGTSFDDLATSKKKQLKGLDKRFPVWLFPFIVTSDPIIKVEGRLKCILDP